MEDIYFYNSNRLPIMSWHKIKRENKKIFFNINITKNIFTIKYEGCIDNTGLLLLMDNLNEIYIGNKNIIEFTLFSPPLKIKLVKDISGIINVKLLFIDSGYNAIMEIAYTFDQSFLPELINHLSLI